MLKHSGDRFPVTDLSERFGALRAELQGHRRLHGGSKLSKIAEASIDSIRRDGRREDTIELVERKGAQGIGANMEEFALPPPWFEAIADVQDSLVTLTSDINQLDSLQNRRLMKVFHDQGILSLESSIKKASSKIYHDLKVNEESLKSVRLHPLPSSNVIQSRIRENALNAASRRLMNTSASLFAVQQKYQEQIAKRTELTTGTKKRSKNDTKALGNGRSKADQLLDDLEEDAPQLAGSIQEDFLQIQQRQERHQNEKVHEMARNVESVHELFMRMADVVQDQGSMVDRIDYNVDQINTQVEEGHKQLLKAEEKQKNSLAKKVIWGLGLWNMSCMLVLGIRIWRKLY